MRYAIVKNTIGRHEFSKWHDDFDLVKAEAERLCMQEKCKFSVMCELAYVEPESPPVKWTVPKPPNIDGEVVPRCA